MKKVLMEINNIKHALKILKMKKMEFNKQHKI